MGVSYRRQLFLKGQAIGKPVNWMSFYIFTRLPIMLISGAFSLVMSFSAFQNLGGLPQQMHTFLFVMLGAEILRYVLSFFTYTNMKKTKPLGFYLNFAVLALDGVSIGLWQGFEASLQTGLEQGLRIGALGLAVSVAVWLVPNVIYFVKRRDMFYLPPQRDLFQETIDQMMRGQMPPAMDQAGSFFEGLNPFESPKATTQPAPSPPVTKEPEPIRSDLYTYCPYCGQVVEKDAQVCVHCHHSLIEEEVKH